VAEKINPDSVECWQTSS